MKKEEFLKELSKTKRDWELINDRKIRRRTKRGLQCPIEAVSSKVAKKCFVNGVWEAADRLKLSSALRESVVVASDGHSFHNVNVRAQILDAVGL